MNSGVKRIILQEIANVIYLRKPEKKIAKEIADEYSVRLQFAGSEKLDKIINDALLANIKNDDITPQKEDLEHSKSIVYDELRMLGVLKD